MKSPVGYHPPDCGPQYEPVCVGRDPPSADADVTTAAGTLGSGWSHGAGIVVGEIAHRGTGRDQKFLAAAVAGLRTFPRKLELDDKL